MRKFIDYHIWSADEEEFIIKNYYKMSFPKMANVLNLRTSQVKARAHRLHLKHTKDKLKEVRQNCIKHNRPFDDADFSKVLNRMLIEWGRILKHYPENKQYVLSKIIQSTNE